MVTTRSMSKLINETTQAQESFIGYKLVFVEPTSILSGLDNNNVFGIAKLSIPSLAQTNMDRTVVNKRYAKYRANHVQVLKIKSIDGKTTYRRAYSALKAGGYYKTGTYTYSDKWNDNINEVCTNGIHFYLSKTAVISLYQSLTFEDTLDQVEGRLNKKSIPNSIYVKSDDDGRIDYKAFYNKNGELYKIVS